MTAENPTLTCPNCGASNAVAGDQIQIKCEYCGSVITVPEELRPHPSAPQPIVIAKEAPRYPRGARKGNGCCSLIASLVVIGILAAAALSLLDNPVPRIVKQVFEDKGIPALLGDQPELVFGGEGTGAGLFQGGVAAITVDRAGNIYAIDHNTLRLQKFDENGKFVTSWNIGEETGAKAQGNKSLASDSKGYIYAIWQGDIFKYNSDGELIKKFSMDTSSDLSIQTYFTLAVLPDQNLLAIGGLAEDVLVWVNAKSGAEMKRIEKPINSLSEENVAAFWIFPAVDGLGNIFLLAGYPPAPFVYKFTPQGKYVSRFGGKGDQPSNLNFPNGIAVDNQSRVYVSDNGIKVFDSNGNYIRKITAGIPFTTFGIAIDDQNRVYAITYDNKIYRFAASE